MMQEASRRRCNKIKLLSLLFVSNLINVACVLTKQGLGGWLHGVFSARAEFQPGLSFSPAKLAENLYDYMSVLASLSPG